MDVTYRDLSGGRRSAPLLRCRRCGGELYAGEAAWRFVGVVLCEDCAAPWLLEELAACRFICGEAAGCR